jgi:hypothetical protein
MGNLSLEALTFLDTYIKIPVSSICSPQNVSKEPIEAAFIQAKTSAKDQCVFEACH